MGEDKYAGDYRVVKHVDPATGKEERRLVYTGEYFSLNLDAREKARRCLLLAGCAAVPLFAQHKRLLLAGGVEGLVFDPYGPVLDLTWTTKQ